MNKTLSKEEVDEIYSKLKPNEIEDLASLIQMAHYKWSVKIRMPSKREIVDWWRMKQRALADSGDSTK